jgi:hypothetical protein
MLSASFLVAAHKLTTGLPGNEILKEYGIGPGRRYYRGAVDAYYISILGTALLRVSRSLYIG